jgi:hypothetical protein
MNDDTANVTLQLGELVNRKPDSLQFIFENNTTELMYSSLIILQQIASKYRIEMNSSVEEFIQNVLSTKIDSSYCKELLNRFFIVTKVQIEQMVGDLEKQNHHLILKNKEYENILSKARKEFEIFKLTKVEGKADVEPLKSKQSLATLSPSLRGPSEHSEMRGKIEEGLLKKLSNLEKDEEETINWFDLFRTTAIFDKMKELIVGGELKAILSNLKLEALEEIQAKTKADLTNRIKAQEKKIEQIIDDKNEQIKHLKRQFKNDLTQIEQIFKKEKQDIKQKYDQKIKKQQNSKTTEITTKHSLETKDFQNEISILQKEKDSLLETITSLEHELCLSETNKRTKQMLKGFENTFSISLKSTQITKEQVTHYLKTSLSLPSHHLRFLSLQTTDSTGNILSKPPTNKQHPLKTLSHTQHSQHTQNPQHPQHTQHTQHSQHTQHTQSTQHTQNAQSTQSSSPTQPLPLIKHSSPQLTQFSAGSPVLSLNSPSSPRNYNSPKTVALEQERPTMLKSFGSGSRSPANVEAPFGAALTVSAALASPSSNVGPGVSSQYCMSPRIGGNVGALSRFQFELLFDVQGKGSRSVLGALEATVRDGSSILSELYPAYFSRNIGKLYCCPDYPLDNFHIIYRNCRYAF